MKKDFLQKEKMQKIWEAIKLAKKPLVVCHVNPDGDTLSSAGIFLDIFQNLGKPVKAFCRDQAGSSLSFIPHVDKINPELKQDFSQFDLILVLDCGALSRTDLAEEILNKKADQIVIEFDHHPKVDDYAELELRDPQAAATVEIIYDFLKCNQIEINKAKADCILTGLLTDTGNFLHANTSEKVLKISSEMLERGADFNQVFKKTWKNKSLNDMKLWGIALNNLEVNEKYGIAFSVLTQEDIETVGGQGNQVFNAIVSTLANIAGIKAVMFLREEGKQIKGSLRTNRDDVDLSYFSQVLGGGGHKKAAGFWLEGKIKKENGRWRII